MAKGLTNSVCLSEDVDEFILATCPCEVFIPESTGIPSEQKKEKRSFFKRNRKVIENTDEKFFNLYPLGKCDLKLLKMLDSNLRIVNTNSEKVITLKITLNQWISGELSYIIKESLWHEVTVFVPGSGTRRQFVLHFETSSEFDEFDHQLKKIFQQLEFSLTRNKTIQDTYLLVAFKKVNAKPEKEQPGKKSDLPVYENITQAGEILPVETNNLKLDQENESTDSESEVECQGHVKGKGSEFKSEIEFQRYVKEDRSEFKSKTENLDHLKEERSEVILSPPFSPAPFASPFSEENLVFTYDEKGINADATELERGVEIEKPDFNSSFYRQPSLKSLLNDEFLRRSGISTNSDYITMKMDQSSDSDPRSEHFKSIGQLLETAIYNGEKEHAQNYVGVLAENRIKVNITVDTTDLKQDHKDSEFSIKVYIEDRYAAGGCINLKVKATDTVRDLKNKMCMKHQFPVEVQRWIIGQRIPKDHETLRHCHVKSAGTAVYLYLVSAKSVGLDREEFENRQAQQILNQGNPGVPVGPQAQLSVESGDYSQMTMGQGFPYSPQTPQSNMSSSSQQTPNRPRSMHSPGSANTLHPGVGQSLQRQQPYGQQGQTLPNMPMQGYGQVKQPHVPPQRLNQPPVVIEHEDPAPELRQDLYGRQQAPAATVQENVVQPEIGWQCPACTYLNLPTRPGCEICATDRPKDYQIPKDYKMTEEEKARLNQEKVMEQKVQQVATTRRPEETTDDDVLANMNERDLDALLKFNDALQIATQQHRDQPQGKEQGEDIPPPLRDNYVRPANAPAAGQMDDIQFPLVAPPGGGPNFDNSDDEN